MKKKLILLLSVIMMLSFTSCGSSEDKDTSDDKNESENISESEVVAGPVYTVDATELDPNIFPTDYPLIASSDFEKDFEVLKSANLNAEIKDYQDLVDIFGVDGAYYENCDLDHNGSLYKYYGWYADNSVSVMITFKSDGNDLVYFAWSGNGIN